MQNNYGPRERAYILAALGHTFLALFWGIALLLMAEFTTAEAAEILAGPAGDRATLYWLIYFIGGHGLLLGIYLAVAVPITIKTEDHTHE